MENITSQKNNKASTVKTISGKHPPEDKTFGFETAIRFYEVEDGDKN